jgi:hypothetical protein
MGYFGDSDKLIDSDVLRLQHVILEHGKCFVNISFKSQHSAFAQGVPAVIIDFNIHFSLANSLNLLFIIIGFIKFRKGAFYIKNINSSELIRKI